VFTVLANYLLDIFFIKAECGLLPPSLVMVLNHEFQRLLVTVQQIISTVPDLLIRLIFEGGKAEVLDFSHIKGEGLLEKGKDLILVEVGFNIILYLPFQFGDV